MTDALERAVAELKPWIGRVRVVEDEIGLTAVRRIAGMLDLDPDSFRPGMELPPHWFTMFFAEVARQSDIGSDGHPRKGLFLPPIPLPRRMAAGRRVRIMGRLKVAEPAQKRAEVVAIEPKHARTGDMILLTMRHTIEARGATIAVDEFDAVYREAAKPAETAAAPAAPTPAPADAAWSHRAHLSEALVFRYGAVTWNAHRIHYDADYTRKEEGYPHTVQNGGLTMQLILDAALKRAPGELTGCTARLARPLWVGETVTLAGRAASGDKMSCWAANSKGELCVQMELEFGR
jgi:3-methylfumaryl-CoA hydratase